jgi:long-subunit fatty acid transport protein
MNRPTRIVSTAALTLAVAAKASAAGIEVPENGAVPLGRGGTAVSSFGTAYALQFNPAGIASVEGLDVRLDGRFVNHDVSFQRAPRAGIPVDFEKVSNGAGTFFAPTVSVAYRSPKLLDGRLSVGAGVWGPPGVGRYAYPDPKAIAAADPDSANSNVNAMAPQRYTLVEQDNLVAMPGLGAAWRLSDTLSLGLVVQVASANVSLRRAIAAKSFNGTEGYDNDAMVTVKVSQAAIPTGTLGVAWSPAARWRVGAAYRHGLTLDARGTMDIELSEAGRRLVSSIDGNAARLQFSLPSTARAGATFLGDGWSASGEVVWEGWSVLDRMTLTPDVSITEAGKAPRKVEPLALEKSLKDAYGARLGGSWRAHDRVELHAGALFETNAIPSKTQAIDYVTGDRLGGSVGTTLTLGGGFSLSVGGMLYKPVTLTVTDSEVRRSSSDTEQPPVIVGNGTYTSNIWVAAVGLGYTNGSF